MKKEIAATPFKLNVHNAKLFIEKLGEDWAAPATLTPGGMYSVFFVASDFDVIKDRDDFSEEDTGDGVVVLKFGIAWRMTE